MHLDTLPDHELLRPHLPMPEALLMQTVHLPDYLTRKILHEFPKGAAEVILKDFSLLLNF